MYYWFLIYILYIYGLDFISDKLIIVLVVFDTQTDLSRSKKNKKQPVYRQFNNLHFVYDDDDIGDTHTGNRTRYGTFGR